MDNLIDANSSYDQIANEMKKAGQNSVFCCHSKKIFELGKLALVNEKLLGITWQLLDLDGYVVRQVISKKRQSNSSLKLSVGLNDHQLQLIHTLEKVLKSCSNSGVQLLGYTDELVAVPDSLKADEIANANAVNIDTSDCYKGVNYNIDSTKT